MLVFHTYWLNNTSTKFYFDVDIITHFDIIMMPGYDFAAAYNYTYQKYLNFTFRYIITMVDDSASSFYIFALPHFKPRASLKLLLYAYIATLRCARTLLHYYFAVCTTYHFVLFTDIDIR